MPHLIIEHSENIKKSSIKTLQTEIQKIMGLVTEGNFDPDQCKCRSFSFDEYLVGKPDQTTSSFIHITIKILSGRTLEARKKLAVKTIEFTKKLMDEIFIDGKNSDYIKAVRESVDFPQLLEREAGYLESKRCDISVDIVEMDKETYQKIRIGS